MEETARNLYLSGRYEEALPLIDLVLAIDGEDLAAHYNAMLCLKALGRSGEAATEAVWYRYYKDDESARSVTADFRREHPYDNRESLPIHVHDEPRPAPAAPAPWIAGIGPKGYVYKGAAPVGELVLHDDRPKGAPRPFAKPLTKHQASRAKPNGGPVALMPAGLRTTTAR